MAQTIADTVGADLFEVVPSDPYTSDDLTWTNNDSRVSREHNNEDLRAVALENTDVDGWDDYDTVFIGDSPLVRGTSPPTKKAFFNCTLACSKTDASVLAAGCSLHFHPVRFVLQ